jgi:hypothetical protein
MVTPDDATLARALAEAARPLLELIGDARCVLVGEAGRAARLRRRLRAELEGENHG